VRQHTSQAITSQAIINITIKIKENHQRLKICQRKITFAISKDGDSEGNFSGKESKGECYFCKKPVH